MRPAAVTVADIEIHAERLDITRAAAIYREHGCVVVRGLMRRWAEAIRQDIEADAARALALLPHAERIDIGWTTPDGTLFLPAPGGFRRRQQIMVLPTTYRTSGALFASAMEPALLDIAEAVLGADIELFMEGQVLYKEPVGGHAKHLHQDSSYFEHRFDGPMAMLGYTVDTDLVNGALHVVPGSHRDGLLRHVDTFSHLGLDPVEWPWERAIAVTGAPGDAILFNVHTIHGSRENRSRASRPVFIHRYRRADDFVVVNATTTADRAHGEARVGAVGDAVLKSAQRGIMVRGRRAFAAQDAPLIQASLGP
ncbi:MAG TPA: phytanoyl-CoA dioxygenase family protein [Planctomycetota bacterium]|nr:phytanoyl-CoA dioxygenase family protein [Planctomycetota bacterium]